MSLKRRGHTSTGKRRRIGTAMCLARARQLLYLSGMVVFSAVSTKSQQKPDPPASPAPTVDTRLLQVKKVCIGQFGVDALGAQARETIIATLFESKRFILTDADDCKEIEADFTLKGSVTEQREQTHRSESEGVSFGEHASSSDRISSSSGGMQGGSHESLSSTETKEHAVVTLRLVNKEGEILWAISHESTGGKTKGAIGDAADRAARRLLRDIERAEKQVAKEDPQKDKTSDAQPVKPPAF